MRFPRQEYWNGLLVPPPGDLPDPGIEPIAPTLVGGFFTTEPPGKPSGTLLHPNSLQLDVLRPLHDLPLLCSSQG